MNASIGKRLVAITWPFVVIVVLMLTLSLVGMSIIASTRAYVTGEGFWSKAERDAVMHLLNYGQSGEAADFDAFEAALSVTLGDRRARLELGKVAPDIAIATQGFLAGRNDAADIPGMIRLFRIGSGIPAFQRAASIWAAGDAQIEHLGNLGRQLRQTMTRTPRDAQTIAATLANITLTHQQLAVLEESFSAQLTELSRQVASLVIAGIAICGFVLLLIGTSVSRRILKRTQAIECKERELAVQLQHQASHDVLTGLANRRRFEQQLQQTIDGFAHDETEHSLLYLDLDQLKTVNDTCGHPAGDALIRQVSGTLLNHLRGSDLLARLGGDEFGVLLHGCGLDSGARIAENVRREIAESRFSWDGNVFPISVSIGVLTLDRAFPSLAAVMSAADRACYIAKNDGRNRVHVFRPDDGELSVRLTDLDWVERISSGLDHGRLVLHAQEIRSLSELPDEPFRCEVLLRLADADGKLSAPMTFLPAAERFGLMAKIDRWVIDQTCRELAARRRETGVPPVCMINLSSASIDDPDLIRFIAERLATTGLPPQSLGFELTETLAITHLARSAQLLRRLKALGCWVALDDYGSGMSSFTVLRTLTLDFLKIDGNFVRDIVDDPVDHTMLVAIQNLAHVIGIRTIAEWVESERTLNALAAVGVDFVQGFAVGMPAPIAEVLRPAATTARVLRVVAS